MERVILQFMCVGSLAGVTYLRYTVLTSHNKGETAVHCCDPTLSVLVMLVSRNVFHVVSALQSIVFKILTPASFNKLFAVLQDFGKQRYFSIFILFDQKMEEQTRPIFEQQSLHHCLGPGTHGQRLLNSTLIRRRAISDFRLQSSKKTRNFLVTSIPHRLSVHTGKIFLVLFMLSFLGLWIFFNIMAVCVLTSKRTRTVSSTADIKLDYS